MTKPGKQGAAKSNRGRGGEDMAPPLRWTGQLEGGHGELLPPEQGGGGWVAGPHSGAREV